MEKGLFAFIRRTSFLEFFFVWVVSLFAFALIYLLFSLGTGLAVEGVPIAFSGAGIFTSIYASFLIATLFGFDRIGHTGFLSFLVWVQVGFTVIILLILLDKLVQKYFAPYHHVSSHQHKKINTVMLLMSIFRTDVDKLRHAITTGARSSISLREIEAIIDGLYVAFLDVEKLLSHQNIYRHRISSIQYLMLTENIEDSLEKLSKFISFAQQHNIEWKDKSTHFWIGYILETAENIASSVDTHKEPKVMIAATNIREYVEKIQEKL